MSKKSILTRAAALAAVASKEGVFVFSSPNKEVLAVEDASAIISELPFTKVHCSECTTEVSLPSELASAQPHCLLCGSRDLKAVEGAQASGEKITFPADDQCASIQCPSCKTVHATQSSVTAALGNELHCITCGQSLKVMAADDFDMSDDEEVSSEDELEEVDLMGDQDPGGLTAGAKDQKTTEKASEKASEKTSEKASEKTSEKTSEKASDDGDEDEDDSEDEDESSEEAKASEKATNVDDSMDSELDMMDDLGDEVEASLLDLDSRLAILVGDKVVATLEHADAKDNKDLWGKAAFHQAIAETLKQHGLKKAVASFGFSPVKLKVKAATMVEKQVTTAKAELQGQFDQAKKTLLATYKQSLDIAATGINKGFWKSVSNPLHAAFVQELATLGIRSPEKLVNRVFAQQGLAYAATLMNQAEQLMAKSAEMRDELAASLDMVNTITAADEDEEDDDGAEMAGSLEIRPLPTSETAALLQSPGKKPQQSSHRTSAIAAILQSHHVDEDSVLFSQ